MEIQIDPHTQARAIERGATTEEIIEVIENGKIIPAKSNKIGKEKVFVFNQERNGKFYGQKKIEVYYLKEQNKIITVTVYVFYGKWEE